jgi:uncharacterized caspase-like protein
MTDSAMMERMLKSRTFQFAGFLMRPAGKVFWALVFLALLCQPAFAGKRVALVIGNSTYRNVARLANPVNDAAVLADTFRKANFDVVDARKDLTITEMRRVLREFGDKARDADIAVIYYAGHGMEVNGMNYLIPVDAQLETDADVYDEALPLDRVLIAVEPAKQLQLIILDACRDNPFSTTMKRSVVSRSMGRGLAKVDISSPNTMIAFAAKAGFTATDGDAKNSPFALALAAHLTTPGMDVRKAFGYVRDDVMKATNNKQEPFIYGSLGGNDVALVPAPAVAAPSPAPFDPNAGIRSDYELAAKVGSKEAWDTFIATYPGGFYAKLAIAQRNKLLAEEARVAAAEKARLAEEQARVAAESAKAAEQAKADTQARAEEQARIAAEKKKASADAKLAAQAKADEDARLAAAKQKADDEARAAQAAKAAEEARIAAEKQKTIEDARLAEAERARAAAQAKAAEEEAKLAEAKTKAEALQQAKAAEDARLALEAARAKAGDNKPGDQQVASLTPPAQTDQASQVAQASQNGSDVTRLLQSELRRVGCNTGAVDGNWNDAAQRSLSLFNRHAGTTLDVKKASLDSLDVVKSKTGRICPLVCDHGYKADGDTCVKITCKVGYQVGDDNSCEKIEGRKPVARREAPAEQPRQQVSPSQAPPSGRQAQTTGQIFCNQSGCQPVHKGCFLTGGGRGQHGGGAQREICP